MRIGLKRFFFTKTFKKKNNIAHAKSVASKLVDSENWSKKKCITKLKRSNMHTKSFSRLVNSENWCQKNIFFKETRTQKVLLD